ncbi:malignant fibrous histiocytoma-amplified sequence 1 homolog [Conger conger]|uniref:malignant fibrous histiocytoma-amplified sequence 1 homolog n=1 Tax=Conger conger TaxID=82655 RepID=UPI002A5A98CF|nr:malignant fibrous histiocytoma-amplified sequence 1 homolog [Conger conger]
MKNVMADYKGVQQARKEDFSRRKLEELPTELFRRAEQVESLDLQVNQLKQVSLISMLVNLKELFLSWNKLSEFPPAIQELGDLEVLYLNQNDIERIPNGVFARLGKLRQLNLSSNRLGELPCDLKQCGRLEFLNLSRNRLQDLQAAVGLPRLRELYVDHNRLVELPAELFLDTGLTSFQAAGNRLQKPPEEVCAGGLKEVRSYFGQMGVGAKVEHTRKVKVMFLGSSMAGKSTLCRSLRVGYAEKVAVSDRTVGIDICEVVREGVQMLFWDFAGQEEYYLTHHVFITPHSFVILAVNLASYSISEPQSFKDNVSFWINNVLMRVPDSVVLPVGTHADQCTDAEFADKKEDIRRKTEAMLEDRRSKLEQRISNIKEKDDPTLFSEQLKRLYQLTTYNLKVLDIMSMDCTKSAEIEKLQEQVLKHVQDRDLFPNLEKTLPRSYQVVESSIRDLIKKKNIPEHGIMAIDELQQCSIVGELDTEDWHCILRYLHRIGIIVWYEEIEALRVKVFTKPSFLITLFKTVVRHDLARCLEDLPRNILQKVNSLGRHKGTWVSDLKSKATLPNAAIAALVHRTLMQQDVAKQKRLVSALAGSRNKEGELVCLLRHFDVCLPTKLSNPLNPNAQEFAQGETWSTSRSSAPTLLNQGSAFLFPGYLKDTEMVRKMWGEDTMEDIRINVYFLPEIPYGVFHRLIIRACSLYSSYWVGSDCCLLGYNTTLVLLRRESEGEDQYIQIRCKRPDKSDDFRRSWDLILTIMRKLSRLAEQWPGLYQIVSSPCREPDCLHDFEWSDFGKLDGRDIYDAVQEEKLLCNNGHRCRTELLFPKVPSGPKAASEQPITHHNITTGHTTVIVNQFPLPESH